MLEAGLGVPTYNSMFKAGLGGAHQERGKGRDRGIIQKLVARLAGIHSLAETVRETLPQNQGERRELTPKEAVL